MAAIAQSKVTLEPIETLLRPQFLTTINLIVRVHHQILDVIKDELDRRDERAINSGQAMLLFKIGDREMTATQLREQGHYLRSNVSHNLKKLTAMGYVRRERSQTALRSIFLRLTEKGGQISKMLDALFDRHLSSLEALINVGHAELIQTNAILDRLERCVRRPECHADRLNPREPRRGALSTIGAQPVL
jgi:DNA-binding MarR family transcriptional regulator